MPPETHQHDQGREVHAHLAQSPLEAELMTHLPLTTAGAAVGLMLAGIICFVSPDRGDLQAGSQSVHAVNDPAPGPDHVGGEHLRAENDMHDHEGHEHLGAFLPLFHLFHPLHMLFSAAATTAMFWRYDKRLLRAIVVGFIGAVGVCGISDILVPHASLLILGRRIPLHICVVEHPGLVVPFAAIGIFVGLIAAIGVTNSTFFSHTLHVFVSTMASVFYMVSAYERLEWITQIGWLFGFIIVAVAGPCCFSDIIFPVAMSRQARENYARSACCH